MKENSPNTISDEVHDAMRNVSDVCRRKGINHYVIGAVSRNTLFTAYGKPFETTRDVDFAIHLGSDAQYLEIKKCLTQLHGFCEGKNFHQMVSPAGIQVDILPYGGISLYQYNPDFIGDTSLPDGFYEVYEHGTIAMDFDEYNLHYCTLQGIVLLKLVAHDDSPNQRIKDIEDVRSILDKWSDIADEEIWEHHSDLYEGREHDEVCLIVLGRKLRDITHVNRHLHDRVVSILYKAINEKSDVLEHLIKDRQAESIADMRRFIELILRGLEDNSWPRKT